MNQKGGYSRYLDRRAKDLSILLDESNRDALLHYYQDNAVLSLADGQKITPSVNRGHIIESMIRLK
jgi:hypothetical protein